MRRSACAIAPAKNVGQEQPIRAASRESMPVCRATKRIPSCEYLGRILFVFAQTADDLSFTQSDWNEGIATWRFNVSTDFSPPRDALHTIFARTLLRAGETVHMKHMRRERNVQGFAFPPSGAAKRRYRSLTRARNKNTELPIEMGSSKASPNPSGRFRKTPSKAIII